MGVQHGRADRHAGGRRGPRRACRTTLARPDQARSPGRPCPPPARRPRPPRRAVPRGGRSMSSLRGAARGASTHSGRSPRSRARARRAPRTRQRQRGRPAGSELPTCAPHDDGASLLESAQVLGGRRGRDARGPRQCPSRMLAAVHEDVDHGGAGSVGEQSCDGCRVLLWHGQSVRARCFGLGRTVAQVSWRIGDELAGAERTEIQRPARG